MAPVASCILRWCEQRASLGARIENWHAHFQKQLGSLRTFLEGKPVRRQDLAWKHQHLEHSMSSQMTLGSYCLEDQDLFVVKPGRGRSYRVEAAMTSQVHFNAQWFKFQVLCFWTLKAVPPSHASDTKTWKKKSSQRSAAWSCAQG